MNRAAESFFHGLFKVRNRLDFTGRHHIGPHIIRKPEFEVSFSIRDPVHLSPPRKTA
jgi:hypothetical protein